jgi:uncharacterized protein
MSTYKWAHFITTSGVFADPLSGDQMEVRMQTHTGTITAMTAAAWRALDDLDPDAAAATADGTRLIAGRFLVPSICDELKELIAENQVALDDDPELYHVIQPTAACQLGCDYCGQEHLSHLLSSEHQDRVIEYLTLRLSRRHWERLKIGWFGAEPLLGMPVIRAMSPRLQGLAEKFGVGYEALVVTNGLNLTRDMARELYQLGVRYVEVTLDGSAQFHDRRRVWKKTGAPSFSAIYSNIQAVLGSPGDTPRLGVRCNTDKTNADGVLELIDQLDRHGLLARLRRFYAAPLHSWGNSVEDVAMSRSEFGAFQIRMFTELMRRGFALALIPTRTKRLCLAVRPDAALTDAFGGVFHCTEVSYVPAYERGRASAAGGLVQIYSKAERLALQATNSFRVHEIGKEAPRESSRLRSFYDEVTAGAYDCHQCPMLPTCGGGCPKAWLEGDRGCPPEKFNIAQRLILDYVFSRSDGRAITASRLTTSAPRKEVPNDEHGSR